MTQAGLSAWATIAAVAVMYGNAGGAAPMPGIQPDNALPTQNPTPIIELRQYTLHPGKRDTLITLFDREFVESQEAVGMKIIGQFRDADDANRFVWLRAFPDMAARKKSLEAFYFGPVWQQHRNAANATLLDNDNVLLLREAQPGSGFRPDGAPRPPRDATELPGGLVVGTIYYLRDAPEAGFAEFFDADIRPHLDAAGVPILATYVPERSANTFPRLPVREGENVFIWFSKFNAAAVFAGRMARFNNTIPKGVMEALKAKLTREPETLRLEPTARSRLGK